VHQVSCALGSDQPFAQKNISSRRQSDHFRYKRQAKQLAADAKAVEAVIRMFDPEFNARAISAGRRVQGNPWFKRGTCSRGAIDVLRAAAAPMTVTEIVVAMLAKQWPTVKQRKGLEAGVPCSLENNAGKSVEHVGEASPKRWKLL
jgi:hypothetical protein